MNSRFLTHTSRYLMFSIINILMQMLEMFCKHCLICQSDKIKSKPRIDGGDPLSSPLIHLNFESYCLAFSQTNTIIYGVELFCYWLKISQSFQTARGCRQHHRLSSHLPRVEYQYFLQPQAELLSRVWRRDGDESGKQRSSAHSRHVRNV